MLLPVRFACCFQHSAGAIKADVGDLIEPIAPELWPTARDGMLLPLLHRLADLDPRMPRRWIDQDLPAQCPPLPRDGDKDRVRSLIQIRFWSLCYLARGARPQPRVVQTAFTLADSITAYIDRPVCAALRLQIHLAANVDPVFQCVRRVACSRRSRDRSGLVGRLAECGALEYAHALAEHMEPKHHPRVLCAFVRQLEDELDRRVLMRLTLAAALKDPESALYALGADMLRTIMHHARDPGPILWEAVLRDHLDHDMEVQI